MKYLVLALATLTAAPAAEACGGRARHAARTSTRAHAYTRTQAPPVAFPLPMPGPGPVVRVAPPVVAHYAYAARSRTTGFAHARAAGRNVQYSAAAPLRRTAATFGALGATGKCPAR